MKSNFEQTISTFGSAVAITTLLSILSNSVYAIERNCKGVYEAEYKFHKTRVVPYPHFLITTFNGESVYKHPTNIIKHSY